MKKLFVIGGAVVVLAAVALALRYFRSNTRAEALHYEREETELIISNDAGAKLTLFKAGNSLQDAIPISSTAEDRFWLPRGNYFLKVEQAGRSFFYPCLLYTSPSP